MEKRLLNNTPAQETPKKPKRKTETTNKREQRKKLRLDGKAYKTISVKDVAAV